GQPPELIWARRALSAPVALVIMVRRMPIPDPGCSVGPGSRGLRTAVQVRTSGPVWSLQKLQRHLAGAAQGRHQRRPAHPVRRRARPDGSGAGVGRPDGASSDERAGLRQNVPGPVVAIIGRVFGGTYRRTIAPAWRGGGGPLRALPPRRGPPRAPGRAARGVGAP